MATYLHFAPAVALAMVAGPRTVGWRLTWLGALCAVVPDADFLLVAWRFDSYSGTYGHRGFTHSLGFALAVGILAFLWPRPAPTGWRRRGGVGLYLALCTASHPLLDGLIDVGICNAWWWPLDGARHCLVWRPVPMRGVALWGAERLGIEALWFGAPLMLLANGGMWVRAIRRRLSAPGRASCDHQVRSIGHGARGGAELAQNERRLQRRKRAQAMQGLALAWQTRPPPPPSQRWTAWDR